MFETFYLTQPSILSTAPFLRLLSNSFIQVLCLYQDQLGQEKHVDLKIDLNINLTEKLLF